MDASPIVQSGASWHPESAGRGRRTLWHGLPGHGLVEDAHYADVITGSA
jgi:hypothetical protein